MNDADTQKDKTELIDIVDEHDVVIGAMPRSQAYAENQRKRIIYVFAIHPKDHTIALAVRGKDVSWRPLHYSATVGGHVQSGESAALSARREMVEEIGVDRDLMLIKSYATTDPTNDYKSYDHIFVTFAAIDEMVLDPVEVDRVEAMSLQAALDFAAASQDLMHPKLHEQLEFVQQDWDKIIACCPL